jgi:predicted permease
MDDLKVSFRQLLKTPGFTLAAIAMLALGIGLNAAMFSVVYALGFAARPFVAPEQLVQIYSRDERTTDDYRAFSFQAYQEVASRRDLFAGVLAHSLTVVGVGQEQESRRALAAIVSDNYFDVLGVPLIRGRGFTAEEARPGHDAPVAVVSYAYWKRAGFDSQVIGSTLSINGRPYTVVGITPQGFTGTMSVFGPELFFPLGVFESLTNDDQNQSQRSLLRPDAFSLFLVARLQDGTSIATASEAVALFGRSLARAFPAEYEHYLWSVAELPKFGSRASPSNEAAVSMFGVVILGMTGAVLLTVCLNLASMLLARGRARRKEFAIRLALGGGRARIVRQLLIEGLLLSILGGILGVGLGNAAIDTLLSTLARLLPVIVVLEGTSPLALTAATITFCLIATLSFALGPALKHSRADILSDLKAQIGDEPAPRRWRFVPRNPLVATQVALSLSLLIAAGLFLRMALGQMVVDHGFRADDTVLAEVDGAMGGLDEARSLDLYEHIEQRLAALPGVQAASVGALVPFGTESISRRVQRAGVRPPQGAMPATPEQGRAFYAPWNAITASYFETTGIPLLQGRPFSTAEAYGKGAPPVAIIDESLAHKLWPEGGALGQRIQFAATDTNPAPSEPLEVVGIVSRTQRELFEDIPRGALYVPLAQGFRSSVYFHVRPTTASDSLVETVRSEIRAAAPALPLFSVKTFAAHVNSSLEYWGIRLSAAMFAALGALAMLVAVVGIYGVTAYGVARRTREIGVRMAVGAKPAMVLRLILGESLRTTMSGIAAGWVLGLGVGQIMASMFVDLAAFDPWTFALVPVGFVLAALVASWVPARRATAVNPVAALRSE